MPGLDTDSVARLGDDEDDSITITPTVPELRRQLGRSLVSRLRVAIESLTQAHDRVTILRGQESSSAIARELKACQQRLLAEGIETRSLSLKLGRCLEAVQTEETSRKAQMWWLLQAEDEGKDGDVDDDDVFVGANATRHSPKAKCSSPSRKKAKAAKFAPRSVEAERDRQLKAWGALDDPLSLV